MVAKRRAAHSLGRYAAQVIRADILNGRFAQGTRLNELRLANELALSRGPIREALRGLEREGFVVSLPNLGSFVSMVTPDYVGEILSLREILEPYAFARAFARWSHSIAGPLIKVLIDMRYAVNRGEFVTLPTLHAQFHGVLYREAPGRLLAETWARLEVPLQIHLQGRRWTTTVASSHVADHEALSETLIAGELDAGRQAILGHLAQAREHLPFPLSGAPRTGKSTGVAAGTKVIGRTTR
jgi:DNA-binding GntR family transcriptional regulator